MLSGGGPVCLPVCDCLCEIVSLFAYVPAAYLFVYAVPKGRSRVLHAIARLFVLPCVPVSWGLLLVLVQVLLRSLVKDVISQTLLGLADNDPGPICRFLALGLWQVMNLFFFCVICEPLFFLLEHIQNVERR